ncbi:dihydroxyacetone kinase [Fusarium pseudocircinatum]|uniref:Dihydroxyacetone kinase n=1 Tax=Fusarium pseudocircinatum TaxID=56676 RepID=A0A8H5LAP1_9HYPO|nr:dihydroxyacetone kinase [Fusarium pseudocircinatum]
MSTKHYFPSTAANTLVPRALRALVRANPHLELDYTDRVVSNAYHDNSLVSIIGGGGSGHEPAWGGFVGDGLLSAAVCGDIFASPSTKQVMKAIRLTPSSQGVILFITNYTGDRLHFGLAMEKAKAEGLVSNIAILAATDDVSIPKSKSSRLGRRGLPGHILTMKILGAASKQHYSFEKCLEIGQAVNDHTVTIGSSLDHCHVPGRQHQSIPQDVCVIGAGIHNEPGQQLISPVPSVEDLITRCIRLLCDSSDPERGFTTFGDGHSIVLVINNYGGLSQLELGALSDEVFAQLESNWNVLPVKALIGTFETSLNAPGFSITLCNLSNAAKQSKCDVDTLLQLLETSTTAVSWPNTTRPAHHEKRQSSSDLGSTSMETPGEGSIQIDPALLQRMIRQACEHIIAAEPKLTEWDMVMGDGDCGEAVKGLCESVLPLLDHEACQTGSVLDFLRQLSGCIDDMGGTLGAIFGILISAFQASLADVAKTWDSSADNASLYATALDQAVTSLLKHTSARQGDRTVMDVLIPFNARFIESGDFASAVELAKEKACETRYMEAKVGRATYVGQFHQVPDPGAWALFEILAGLAEVLSSSS